MQVYNSLTQMLKCFKIHTSFCVISNCSMVFGPAFDLRGPEPTLVVEFVGTLPQKMNHANSH